MTQKNSQPPQHSGPWYQILYVQVLLGVVLGIIAGYCFPNLATSFKVLGEGFVNLIKMMIPPIIFCTIVHGIASVGNLSKLGRVGFKSLIYFELVSTIALVIGLIVVNQLEPGVGITPAGEVYQADQKALLDGERFQTKAHNLSVQSFLLGMIPTTLFSAFVSGEMLQVLFVSVLVAFAVVGLGEHGKRVLDWIEVANEVFFGVMKIVVRAAPVGAFGAMGYTIGAFGLGTLNKLIFLMACFYLTSGVFVFVVLGAICWYCGFPIHRFLMYIKDELLLVLGTSSSESALPGLMDKMQRLGCAKSTVGIVVPTGYSFNLDGTNIYMAMAAIFLAQATNTHLSFYSQLSLLLIAMLTSKGASGVTGAGFVALAATLDVVQQIPISALSLLIGIDRFMSECRAITNFIGNAVATLAISYWEGEINKESLQRRLQEATHHHTPIS